MTRYLVWRGIGSIPLLIGITVLVFAIIHSVPGGPMAIYGNDPSMTPEEIARMERNLGLDQPVFAQYATWLQRLLQGDLGTSFREHRPVGEVIRERLPVTLELTVAALLFGFLTALLISLFSARHESSAVRWLLNVGSAFGICTPTFWTGTLAILVFAAYLNWLPAGGRLSLGASFTVADWLRHLIMPTIVLGLPGLAAWARYLHSSLLDVLYEDYVRTARAKGLAERVVLYRHALRNALIPVITLLALDLPRLLVGAIVTEAVFAWPGLGQLLAASLLNRDYPVVMAVLLMTAFIVIVGNLLADVLYAVVDPRVRYG